MRILKYRNVALEVHDLKDYIIDELIRNARIVYHFSMSEIRYPRPYWKKRLQKNLDKTDCILAFAKTTTVDHIIKQAVAHFDKNPRHRAFNVLLSDVYMGRHLSRDNKGLMKRKYHYYLAIRISKRRFKIRGRRDKILCYVARVHSMCPWGQVIHSDMGVRK